MFNTLDVAFVIFLVFLCLLLAHSNILMKLNEGLNWQTGYSHIFKA